jgi:hypothetical protein
VKPAREGKGGEACANPHNHRITVICDGSDKPYGTITISPGPVAPGEIAAVRTPNGRLTIKRIYYYREGGREFVRLADLLPAEKEAHHPLSEVTIEGTVVCVVKVGQRCEKCDEVQGRAQQRPARAAKRRTRPARPTVDELDWPEYIGGGA